MSSDDVEDNTPPAETFTPDDEADYSTERLGVPAPWLDEIPPDAGSDTPLPEEDDNG